MKPGAQARTAGFLYLIVILTGGWAQLFVRMQLIIRDDAAATAHNIMAHGSLYRAGLVADLVSAATYVGVTALLYAVLQPAGKGLSRLAVLFSLAGCSIMAGNLVNLVAPLLLLGDAPLALPLPADELQALGLLFLRLQVYGYLIAVVFFGLYCFTLGCLIVRSLFLPHILGLLLMLGGLCYLANSGAAFLAPAVATKVSAYLLALPGIAEIALALWLAIFGVNTGKWLEQAKR